jgi:hypothetical protein
VNLQKKMLAKMAVLAALVCALAGLEGCGSSNGNSFTPTAANPAPGVTLQNIKITPATPLLQLASNRQLYATGVYSNGSSSDVTSDVTWTASGISGTTGAVSVSSKGVATGAALGPGVVTATLGGVVGVLQLTVNSDGYASSTLAILQVPYKTSVIDVAYQAHGVTQTQGAYDVEEINLDADQFTSQLPVAAAVLASIPMPQGFVPNATIASPSNALVAVISYTSPQVIIIDASNLAQDPLSNTIVSTFTAPITQSVTFNNTTCMICAGVVNPGNDSFLPNTLILSTAQGYYTMNLTTGAFAPIAFSSTAFPAPGFVLNPVAAPPYIVSPTFGQDPQNPSEVQILTLPTGSGQGTVTTYTDFGLTQPNAAAIDLLASQASGVSANDLAVVDVGANDQALVTLGSGPSSTSSVSASPMGLCSGTSTPLSMVALGTASSLEPSQVSPTLFLAQPSGNCVGFEIWPSQASGSPFGDVYPDVQYAYGSMPNTPDGNVFMTGSDPNMIATFTSVIDKNNYGVLVDGTQNVNQNWIAKVELSGSKGGNAQGIVNLASDGYQDPPNLPPPGCNASSPVPCAESLIPPSYIIAGLASGNVIYLPTPDSVAILSANYIDFGAVAVGTPSLAVNVTVTNVGLNNLDISGITISGTNAGDFSYTTSCSTTLASATNCSVSVIFTPTAAISCPSTASPQVPCATLNVADNGGQSPQLVQLYGTGQ